MLNSTVFLDGLFAVSAALFVPAVLCVLLWTAFAKIVKKCIRAIFK